jgi:chromobox protein 1
MPLELYEIEKIVDGPNEKGQYFIKWEGYPDEQNTWEPPEHLPEDILAEYLNPMKELRVKRREDTKAEKQGKSKRQASSAWSFVTCGSSRKTMWSCVESGREH